MINIVQLNATNSVLYSGCYQGGPLNIYDFVRDESYNYIPSRANEDFAVSIHRNHEGLPTAVSSFRGEVVRIIFATKSDIDTAVENKLYETVEGKF